MAGPAPTTLTNQKDRSDRPVHSSGGLWHRRIATLAVFAVPGKPAFVGQRQPVDLTPDALQYLMIVDNQLWLEVVEIFKNVEERGIRPLHNQTTNHGSRFRRQRSEHRIIGGGLLHFGR